MKACLFIALVLSISCGGSADIRLESALESAGENRGELEKVLLHYSGNVEDSLKYRAARFLIENMPYHYSHVLTDSIEFYLNRIESTMISLLDTPYVIRDSIFRKLMKSYSGVSFRTREDTKIITSDFLIRNIDHSFDVWKNQTWGQHLSFDEFCEFILPYKIFDGQLLDDWKIDFYATYNHLLSNLKYSSIISNSSYMACDIINNALKEEVKPVVNPGDYKSLIKLRTHRFISSGPCDAYTNLANAAMRANGIPSGIDFTPQWPFRSLGHSWNFLHENTKKNIVFEGANSTVGSPHKKDYIMAKVFRRTYGANKELENLIRKEEFVPPVFSTPCLYDVTEEYMSTVDIEIDVDIDNRYVYLSVFNDRDWEVLAWGKSTRGKASFENMGKNTLYLPVAYTKKGIRPIGDPFIVYLNSDIKPVKADTSKRQSIKLFRKFPMLPHVYSTNLAKIGAKIQAANRSDFSDSVTLYEFKDFENDVNINCQGQRYRYWRFLSSDGGHSSVAEIEFFSEGNNFPVIGDMIGTDGSFMPGNQYKKEAALDNDLLTFFYGPQSSGTWVGMDFSKPVDINRVVCIMRSDGNEIEAGDEYELVFWSEGKWKSLGRKIATDISVEFNECPTNALFLLHNRTKGIEERIFTYENGEQVWW